MQDKCGKYQEKMQEMAEDQGNADINHMCWYVHLIFNNVPQIWRLSIFFHFTQYVTYRPTRIRSDRRKKLALEILKNQCF